MRGSVPRSQVILVSNNMSQIFCDGKSMGNILKYQFNNSDINILLITLELITRRGKKTNDNK